MTEAPPEPVADTRAWTAAGGTLPRFGVAALAAVVTEFANLGLGRLTQVPTLEPLPVVVLLAGVLFGWAGVAGCAFGQVLYRLWFHDPWGWFGRSDAADALLAQAAGIPLAYSLIGILGYLSFRLSTGVGRGFPNSRSYLTLVTAAAAGGAVTALNITLQFSPSLKGFLVHSASNFVSILLVSPPLLMLADRYLRSWTIAIPGELRTAIPFPDNLDLPVPGDGEPRQRLEARMAVLGAVIVLITLVALPLAHRIPQVGGWPLLAYLGPVVWTAMTHGMRGGLLATSVSGVLYLIGRSWLDRDVLPDEPDVYAVGLYADFVVFSLVAVFLGSEREEELRLRAEIVARARQATTLNDMGDLLQASVSAREAYEVIAHGVHELFPTESGSLSILQRSSQLLEVVLAWGASPPTGDRIFATEDCWGLRRGHLHYVEDPRKEPTCRHLDKESAASYLCVPLVAHGEALGVLHLEHTEQSLDAQNQGLNLAKRELALATAKEIGLALGNLRLRERLHAQSIRDPLTGLFNRRYLTETLERERFRARRQELSFGLMMIDIDRFKLFNDQHGHAAGDVVLRELGQFLQTRARREDIVCRYGGEEFVIVLSEASLEITRQRAEELRNEVKQLRLRHEGQILAALRLSFGVAAFPTHGDTEKDVLRAADAALYRAKAAGRDRVVVAEVLNQPPGADG